MRILCTLYTDALFAKKKSIMENTYAQIFTNKQGFVYVHPISYKSQDGEALNIMKMDIGVPNTLLSDNAGE